MNRPVHHFYELMYLSVRHCCCVITGMAGCTSVLAGVHAPACVLQLCTQVEGWPACRPSGRRAMADAQGLMEQHTGSACRLVQEGSVPQAGQQCGEVRGAAAAAAARRQRQVRCQGRLCAAAAAAAAAAATAPLPSSPQAYSTTQANSTAQAGALAVLCKAPGLLACRTTCLAQLQDCLTKQPHLFFDCCVARTAVLLMPGAGLKLMLRHDHTVCKGE